MTILILCNYAEQRQEKENDRMWADNEHVNVECWDAGTTYL